MWYIIFIDLQYIEPSLHPWDKLQLIMVYDPFNVLLNLLMYCGFANILLRIFSFMFISDVGLWFCVCVCVCDAFVWFWYQGDADLVEWVWKHSFLFSFLNSLKKIGVNCSLNIWSDLPVKVSSPGLLFWGNFKNYWCNIITGYRSAHIFCFFWICSWEGTFPGIYSFILGCQFIGM